MFTDGNQLGLRHGFAKKGHASLTYKTWKSMRARCQKKSSGYLVRGITVCERWDNFENFLKDMGERPWTKAEIDRIDTNKGYYPENCRWATRTTQNNNRVDTVTIDYGGETKTRAEWAKLIGISYLTFCSRMNYGWSIERIITTPPRKTNRIYK